MNVELVDKVVAAVLYEGYMLYPYRPSAVKNRQRWTFGGIFPQVYGQAQGGAEASSMQTECLVECEEDAELTVQLRFLHLTERTIGELAEPQAELPAVPTLRPVPALEVDGRLFQSWQEAVERRVVIEDVVVGKLIGRELRKPFGFPAERQVEPLRRSDGLVAAAFIRERQALAGQLKLVVEQVGRNVYRLRVRVINLSALAEVGDRDEAQRRSLASSHLILGVEKGAFVSLFDPPGSLAEAAAACRNVGVWPVLVGEEGQRDTLLASPIILYDHPQIAPESPGDLFDGTEIDEILTLRIMTMTDQEKREMGAVDERTRALLERTESLAGDELLRMHGTVRSLRPLGERNE